MTEEKLQKIWCEYHRTVRDQIAATINSLSRQIDDLSRSGEQAKERYVLIHRRRFLEDQIRKLTALLRLKSELPEIAITVGYEVIIGEKQYRIDPRRPLGALDTSTHLVCNGEGLYTLHPRQRFDNAVDQAVRLMKPNRNLVFYSGGIVYKYDGMVEGSGRPRLRDDEGNTYIARNHRFERIPSSSGISQAPFNLEAPESDREAIPIPLLEKEAVWIERPRPGQHPPPMDQYRLWISEDGGISCHLLSRKGAVLALRRRLDRIQFGMTVIPPRIKTHKVRPTLLSDYFPFPVDLKNDSLFEPTITPTHLPTRHYRVTLETFEDLDVFIATDAEPFNLGDMNIETIAAEIAKIDPRTFSSGSILVYTPNIGLLRHESRHFVSGTHFLPRSQEHFLNGHEATFLFSDGQNRVRTLAHEELGHRFLSHQNLDHQQALAQEVVAALLDLAYPDRFGSYARTNYREYLAVVASHHGDPGLREQARVGAPMAMELFDVLLSSPRTCRPADKLVRLVGLNSAAVG